MVAEANVRYCLPDSFDEAIGSVCGVLRERGMRVARRLDVSGRLGRSLGIAVSQCQIIFVLPGAGNLKSAPIHPWAGVFLPLHVVICGDDSQSEVLIQNRILPGHSVGAITPEGPVVELQEQLFKAMQSIAARSSILA